MKGQAKELEKEQIKQMEQIMVSAVQVQTFKQQFKDTTNTIKLFSSIEQQFIKRFRFKNQENYSRNQFQEFVIGFKQTLKYYQSYHQYIQTTLEKYIFCNKLRKFIKQLFKSQSKIINFFTTQIQFHSVFIREKEEQFTKTIENLTNICVRCKQIQNKRNIQNIKQQLHFPFKNAFKMYKDLNCADCYQNTQNEKQQNYIQNIDLQGYNISSAQVKLKNIIQKNKKSQISALSQIIDMFQKKEEAQFNTVNKSKINQMFYELQNQLQNRTFQIEQYLQDLSLFNQKLMTYNPHLTSTCQPYQQIEPNIVQKQLKYNFHKIIKKIYAKINQLIQKRKDESVSKHVQVNFTQDHIIKQLQRQKKKLSSDLRQCYQEKQYTINGLKAQIQRISQQLILVSDEKLKIQIIKSQYFNEKQDLSKQNIQLTKIIQKLKKQMQNIQKYLGKQNKFELKKNLKEKQQSLQQQQNQKQFDIQDQKKSKQAQNALIYQFQQRQQQLLRKLQNKNKKGKKGFLAPRRSKVLQVINLQQLNIGGLQKTVSRFSKDINLQEINLQTVQNQKEQKSLFFKEANSPNQTPQSQSIQEQFEKKEQQDQKIQKQHEKESRFQKNKRQAKTSTRIDKTKNESLQIKSNKSISQTSDDVRKQIQELQQLKKLKLIESKMIHMSQKNNKINFNQTEINKLYKQLSTDQKNKLKDHSQSSQFKNIRDNNKIQLKTKQIVSIESITSSNYLQVYNDYLKQNQLQITRGVQTEQLSSVIYKILYDYQIAKNNFNSSILTFNAFKFGYDQFLSQITHLIQKQQKNPIRKLNMYKGSSFILKKSHNYRFNKKQFLNTFHSNQKQNTNQENQYFISKYKNQSFKENIMSKTTNNYSAYKQSAERDISQKTMLNFSKTNQNLTFNSLAYKTFSDLKNISLDKKRRKQYGNTELVFDCIKLKSEHNESSNNMNLNYDVRKVSLNEIKKKQIKKWNIHEFITKQNIENLFFSFQTAKKIQQKEKMVQLKNLNNVQIRFSTELLTVIANIHLLSIEHYKYIKSILTSPSKFFNKNQFQTLVSNQDDYDLNQNRLNQNLHDLIFLHRNCLTKNRLKQLVNKKLSKQSNTNKTQQEKSTFICSHLKVFLTKISDLIKHLNENNRNDSTFESANTQKITSIQNIKSKI